MASIALFHHVHGLTDGVRAFASALEAHGHRVSTPDLFDGQTFAPLAEGMAHAESAGMAAIAERGAAAADPDATVFVGFSLGALPAQKLAQTRRGAQAAVLIHAAVPLGFFGDTWPPSVALQIHTAEHDERGDADVARELVKQAPGAELFLYPGTDHLTTDSSLPAYDPTTAGHVLQRTIGLLDRL
ncbi:dienelactone hydrolase family protein [Actinokineospora guangxiensis]|uniref:Dienelactone hydrolase family protein n=1 Tax=Actinokineospora guangxiensis TaxID=1490288 RepID=A0ABW0ET99_9PSEU